MKNAKLLHEKALRIAKSYLRAEADLLDILQKIDETRAYRELGHRSLFDYATRALGLGENVAYTLITVARKALEVPLLKEKIATQEISISNARAIAPVLTQENQEKWISAAQGLSRRELEREVARERPELLAPERTRYVMDDRVKLEMGLSEELHQALKRAQDLVSSRKLKAVSLEETLEVLVAAYLEREDPLLKARRAAARKEKLETAKEQNSAQEFASRESSAQEKPQDPPALAGKLLAPGRAIDFHPPTRRPLPASLKHALALRDGDRCTHRNAEGVRCPERRWLQVHHLRPVSRGGSDSLENVATLCAWHHKWLHSENEQRQNFERAPISP